MTTAQIVSQALRETTREVPPKAKATIDIDEPIELIKGYEKYVDFRYFTGDPVAYLPFGMRFHRTEEDAESDTDRLTSDIPHYKLNPSRPFSYPNSNFEGTAKFYVPSDYTYDVIWGVIIIYQDLSFEDVLTPIGDPKSMPVSPIQSPRRRHIPTWENNP